MAREVARRTIDGKEYQFSQFTTTVSLKILSRLTRLLGEPLTLGAAALFGGTPAKPAVSEGAADAIKDAKKGKTLNVDLLGKAVKALVERLDEDEVVDLTKRLASEGVLCDNKPIVFDLHFQGETLHLFKVLSASLEVQYGNFIVAATGQFGAATGPIGAV